MTVGEIPVTGAFRPMAELVVDCTCESDVAADRFALSCLGADNAYRHWPGKICLGCWMGAGEVMPQTLCVRDHPRCALCGQIAAECPTPDAHTRGGGQ